MEPPGGRPEDDEGSGMSGGDGAAGAEPEDDEGSGVSGGDGAAGGGPGDDEGGGVSGGYEPQEGRAAGSALDCTHWRQR